jgi:hypothetical protein
MKRINIGTMASYRINDMNKYIAILLLAFSGSAFAASYSTNHDKVMNYFKSSQEKSVLDAVWTGETIFAVGRFSDGTRHDGFAMYVCNILYDYGFRGKRVMVNVIDIVKLKNTGK